MSKKVIIITGSNGAGKTTLAHAFLPKAAACTRFINADLITADLSPFAPEYDNSDNNLVLIEWGEK